MPKISLEKEEKIKKELLAGVPMKEIQQKLSCSRTTVRRMKNDLKQENAETFEGRKQLMMLEFLGKEHFVNELETQFEQHELESYVDYYFTYKDQFQDILGTEKTQLDLTIRLYLLLNRILRRLKTEESVFSSLSADMAEITSKSDNEKDPHKAREYKDNKMMLIPQLQNVSQNIDKLNKQAQEFEKNQRSSLEKLDATRKDRLQKGIGIDQEWTDLIKGLEDKKTREIHSQLAERLRIAQERQAEQMRKLHPFADKTEDFLLLDDGVIIEDEE